MILVTKIQKHGLKTKAKQKNLFFYSAIFSEFVLLKNLKLTLDGSLKATLASFSKTRSVRPVLVNVRGLRC